MKIYNNIDIINIYIYLNLENKKKNGIKPPNKINVIYNNSIIYIYYLILLYIN